MGGSGQNSGEIELASSTFDTGEAKLLILYNANKRLNYFIKQRK